MKRYQTFDPNTEINGLTTMALVKNIMQDDISAILEKHGLGNIDPQQWYPVQSLLDVFNEIAEGGDAPSAFVSIGMGAGELGYQALPEPMKSITLEQFLASYNQVWQTRHRNGDVGYVQYEKVSDDHFIMRIKMPYPDDVIYGVFYAYCRHLTPKNRHFVLSYDEDVLRQEDGGDETVLHIRLKL